MNNRSKIIAPRRAELGASGTAIIMKSDRLTTVRIATLIALVLCVLLFFYMAVGMPNCFTSWADRQWADKQIQKAQSVEQLQVLARSASHHIAMTQASFAILVGVAMLAMVGMAIFLGWCWFTLGRIEREDSNAPDVVKTKP